MRCVERVAKASQHLSANHAAERTNELARRNRPGVACTESPPRASLPGDAAHISTHGSPGDADAAADGVHAGADEEANARKQRIAQRRFVDSREASRVVMFASHLCQRGWCGQEDACKRAAENSHAAIESSHRTPVPHSSRCQHNRRANDFTILAYLKKGSERGRIRGLRER